MAELTQEYLDKSLKNLPTKQNVADIVDAKIKDLPTKQDVQTIVDGAVESLARIIGTTVVEPMNQGFDGIEKRLGSLEEGHEGIIERLGNLEQGQEEILLKLDNKANKIDLPSFPKHIVRK